MNTQEQEDLFLLGVLLQGFSLSAERWKAGKITKEQFSLDVDKAIEQLGSIYENFSESLRGK